MFDGSGKDVYLFFTFVTIPHVPFVIYMFSSVYTMHDVYDPNIAYLPIYICLQEFEQLTSIARVRLIVIHVVMLLRNRCKGTSTSMSRNWPSSRHRRRREHRRTNFIFVHLDCICHTLLLTQ